MIEQRIWEALDACRPGSEDLQQPEMAEAAGELAHDPQLAELARQSAALDARIMAAMHDLPVPEDLSARLLARLAAQTKEPQTVETAAPAAEESVVERRRWVPTLRWAAVAALAAALLVGASLSFRQPAPPVLTPQNVQEFAQQQYEALQQDGKWQPIGSAPRQAYPLSGRVAARAWAWRSFRSPVDPDAVAYDLTMRGSKYQVTLLVMQTKVPGLTSLPPKKPVWTQGRLISAWQQNGRLYVLVLEAPPGGSQSLPHRYRSLVDTTPGIVS